MATHTQKVRTSDYEWFDVLFDSGKAIQVIRSQVVWSDGKSKAASSTMSARVAKIIELAEIEVWGHR